ncbi:MAG: ABC transporter ATP-binding protein [Myxococcota bacterium]
MTHTPKPHDAVDRDPLEDVVVTPEQRRARLRAPFLKYKWWFVAGALFLVLTNTLALSIPARIGEAVGVLHGVQGAGEGAVRAELVGLGVAIIALAIGAGGARIMSRIFIFNAGRYIEFDLRNELYAKLATLDAGFYNAIPTGDITSRVTNDINYIRTLYAITFLHAINTALAFSIALSRMSSIDLTLTLWCLLPYPFMVFALRRVILALFHQTKRVQAQMSGLSSRVQENLSGVAVVKAFNLQEREIERFEQINQGYYSRSMRLALIRGALSALTMLLAGLGTLVVLVVGSQRVEAGTLELAQFVEFNAYVVSLAFPTSALGWVFSVWHRGQAAFDRVLGIFYWRPAVLDPLPDALEHLPERDGSARGAIVFEDVSFSYEEGQPVLEHVSIDIPAGSRVALVGKTSSGKSTLVKLMARMYDPTSGRITLDGVALEELGLRELRSELGFVSQDPFLFSMTIGQNVRFGLDALEGDSSIARHAPTRSLLDPDVEGLDQAKRLDEALAVAGMSAEIDSFPQGLGTLVGERGITLSGGQKQRVTIARALLVDPRVLILDDALSSVDAQTEAVILDHLDEIMTGRTSILLTHRYNALPRMDCIYVLDHGRVVERGSHDELIAERGVYAEMYEKQKLRESLES